VLESLFSVILNVAEAAAESPLVLIFNTKSVNVFGIAENVTDAADEPSVLLAMSVYVLAKAITSFSVIDC
jgi:hypothetical protein